jgi:hypothetical protein
VGSFCNNETPSLRPREPGVDRRENREDIEELVKRLINERLVELRDHVIDLVRRELETFEE